MIDLVYYLDCINLKSVISLYFWIIMFFLLTLVSILASRELLHVDLVYNFLYGNKNIILIID